jgi:hypothetical protein
MESQRNISKEEGRRDKTRSFVAGLNNLDISSESVVALTEGYIGGNLEGIFPFGEEAETVKGALLNVGHLKERFDSYLHVIRLAVEANV